MQVVYDVTEPQTESGWAMADMREEVDKRYASLCEELDGLEDGSPEFLAAFNEIKKIAESGYVRACALLAEVQATSSSVFDAEAAYIWYYISLKEAGYSVRYENEYEGSDDYLGPLGDFRNESMVSDLVAIIGVKKIPELDGRAIAWIEAHVKA